MECRPLFVLALACAFGLSASRLIAQTEVSGWGNLRGMRVGDELIPFSTAIGIYNPDYTQLTLSQREGPTHTTQYARDGDALTVGIHLQYGSRPPATNAATPVAAAPGTSPPTRPTTNPAATRPRGGGGGRGTPQPGLDATATYNDSSPGVCDVKVHLTSTTALNTGGIYYFLTFPAADYADATAHLIAAQGDVEKPLASPKESGRFLAGKGTGLRIKTKSNRTIEVTFPQALDVIVQREIGRDKHDIQVFFPLMVGSVAAGQAQDVSFQIKATGEADTNAVTIALDPAQTGRPFEGIGGNFRIQSPNDAAHIRYIFDNLRVAHGRVAMPWNVWQPEQNSSPMQASPPTTSMPATQPSGGNMNSISSAMEIAQTLAKKNIPMVISCWSPPQWATLPPANGNGGFNGGNGGERGMRLDPAKWDAICESIGSYLIYLRDHYGAEPLLFSFNESNIGINVRQSPEEHNEAIKKLGAHFKAIGLKTRMLLGDTGDVPPFKFIEPALNDAEAAPYIGAISFHSWRGATDEQYQRWADAAQKLGVPLMDAEGGNDAQAYSYPNVFREAWYSLDEAAEYVRIMRICQPQTILQWQFTNDYSVLYADSSGAMHPTQRFFNLKQMNLTPAGSAWMKAQSSSESVLSAAFIDQASAVSTTHLVNNGAARPLTVTGLPAKISRLDVYITDARRGMEKLDPINVKNGQAHLTLPARSLVTLISSSAAQ